MVSFPERYDSKECLRAVGRISSGGWKNFFGRLGICWELSLENLVGLASFSLTLRLQKVNDFACQNEATVFKSALSDYFFKRVEEGMDELEDSGLWSQEKSDEIMKKHLHTPYVYWWKVLAVTMIAAWNILDFSWMKFKVAKVASKDKNCET